MPFDLVGVSRFPLFCVRTRVQIKRVMLKSNPFIQISMECAAFADAAGLKGSAKRCPLPSRHENGVDMFRRVPVEHDESGEDLYTYPVMLERGVKYLPSEVMRPIRVGDVASLL